MDELKHDGYRIHIRDGRVQLNAPDWSVRYPLIVEEAAKIKGAVEEAARIKDAAIIDAEVVCAGKDRKPDFHRTHGGCFDHLLLLNGDDLRRKTFAERKAMLRGAFSTSNPSTAMAMRYFEAVRKLGLEGIVSKKLNAPYKYGHQRRGSRSKIRKRWHS